jgi:hypothetical protein
MDMSDDCNWPPRRLHDLQLVKVTVVTFKFGPPFSSLSHTPEVSNLWFSYALHNLRTKLFETDQVCSRLERWGVYTLSKIYLRLYHQKIVMNRVTLSLENY